MPIKFVDLDGTVVHCLHSGPTTLPEDAPALDRGRLFVLVHGSGRNAADWQRQLESLGREHSAVALDLPGHGRSPQVDGLARVEACADVLERFVERLGLRPAVVVGWDLGAAVAMVAAARRPERFRGLALLGAALRFPLPDEVIAAVHDVVRGRRPQIFDTSWFAPSTPMETMREVWTEQVKTDPRVLHTDLLAGRAFDWATAAAAVRLPTLVVSGSDDGITPPAVAHELAAAIPGARCVTIDGAGHALLREQPERVNALLAEFAQGLAA